MTVFFITIAMLIYFIGVMFLYTYVWKLSAR